jgi:hypothetical protein
MWASGIIIYKLLFGYIKHPFKSDRPLPRSVIERCILENDVKFDQLHLESAINLSSLNKIDNKVRGNMEVSKGAK